MIKKLLKYDLKYVYKSQIFLYASIIGCLIITKIFQVDDKKAFLHYSIHLSFLIFTYAAILVLIINTLTRLWTRFKNNVLGEESYLIHTLPVTKKDIYLSKTISSIITLSTSLVFAFIVDLIVRDFMPMELMALSSTTGDAISSLSQYMYNLQLYVMTWFMILIVLISISLVGYFSLILGNQSNKNKLIKSLMIGVSIFILSFIIILVLSVSIFIIIANIISMDFGLEIFLIAIFCICYIIASLTYYFFGLSDLKQGVDVE